MDAILDDYHNYQVESLQLQIAEVKGRNCNPNTKKKTIRKLKSQLKALEYDCRVCASGNFLPSSNPGCFVSFNEDTEWIVGTESITLSTFDMNSVVPEISVDPTDLLLSFINTCPTTHKSFTVSVFGGCLPVTNSDDEIFQHGYSCNDGEMKYCVTFVVRVAPSRMMDIAFLSKLPEEGDIVSDIKDWYPLPSPEQNIPCVLGFPLGGHDPFLCSQGFDGHFTHIFSANRFAIDLECPDGTPVLAVGDGVVVSTKDSEVDSGISASNYFKWNAIIIELDTGYFVEYVHIKHRSILVNIGERVSKGTLLCSAGAVGFSPKPHLHLQVTETLDDDAMTIPFTILCKEANPVAGYEERKSQILRAGRSYFS